MEALILVGHGSHLNAASDEPVFEHADRIRASGAFDEVREAFWKEEPSLREVLRTLASDTVYVVPLFVSEGYFTDLVLPRELRLADGSAHDVDKSVHYAEPVGTHDAMADVIVGRAESVTGDPDVGEDVGLAVVGHGTERHADSARSTRYHAGRIRDRDRFADVRSFFMDEAPRVESIPASFGTPDVVVVPLFVADGYHTQEDIPEDLGLTTDHRDGWDVPANVHGRRLWYAGAVGTEPVMADVILERGAEAGADVDRDRGLLAEERHTSENDGRRTVESEAITAAERAFLDWIDGATSERGGSTDESGSRRWGQLRIAPDRDRGGGDRRYDLRHVEDADAAGPVLEAYDDPLVAREIAKFDDRGRYRPLKTAPTLATGWVFPGLTPGELLEAVDFFYPATVANWHRERRDELDVTHWCETAERQTGIYEIVEELPPEALEWAVTACCVDSECLKRRRWDYDGDRELDVSRGAGEFPCREPCSFLVAAARAWTILEREEVETGKFELTPSEHAQVEAIVDAVADGRIDESRVADFDDPANRFRARYLRAKRFDE